MARRTASKSTADSDGTSSAIAAQQRIMQLKKERDGRMKSVVAKVLADLDDIKLKVSQGRDEHERQRKQHKAQILSGIAKSMQKRNAIEEDMMAVVSNVNTVMTRLESRVMDVYDVKERQVQHLLREEQN
ncbi:hypothetical protein V2A60_000139 [Cordyceps javanica]